MNYLLNYNNMNDSNYYPLGAEHDPRAPWNQNPVTPIEMNDYIPVWIAPDERITVRFKVRLIIEDEDEMTVRVMDFDYPAWGFGWEDDIKAYYNKEYDKKIINLEL